MDHEIAHGWMVGHLCESCSEEVLEGQPVLVDVDGGYGDDGSRVVTRVAHVICPEVE